MKNVEIGEIYEHYKGTKAKVIGEGFNSETLEPMVFYIHLEDGVIWARPKKMFQDVVKVDSKKLPRFKKINQRILIKPAKK